MSKLTKLLTALLITFATASASADVTISFVNKTGSSFKTSSIPDEGIITQFSKAYTTALFIIPTAKIAPVLIKHPDLQVTYLLTQPSMQYYPCHNSPIVDGGHYTATISGAQDAYKCQWAISSLK